MKVYKCSECRNVFGYPMEVVTVVEVENMEFADRGLRPSFVELAIGLCRTCLKRYEIAIGAAGNDRI